MRRGLLCSIFIEGAKQASCLAWHIRGYDDLAGAGLSHPTLAHATPARAALTGTLRQELQSPLGTSRVFLLHLLEKLSEFLIAALLGIADILAVRLTTLQGVIHNTY
jgi:hypothetical protein